MLQLLLISCPKVWAYLLNLMVHFAISKTQACFSNPPRPLNAARVTFAPNRDRILEEE